MVVSAQQIIEPEQRELAAGLRRQGYCMIDRTLRATVSLGKKANFAPFCRIPVEEYEGELERIYEIAETSFLLDSRFMAHAEADEGEIRQKIHARVGQMRKFYVCRCKGEVAGFLELARDEKATQEAEISLAAVDAKYRVAGAALSLYAGVAKLCQEQGLKRLWGRISARNVSVMNLYAALGASFSLPYDVYVRSHKNA